MAAISVAGPGEGVANPEDVEAVHVDPGADEYGAPGEVRTLVLMWNGNEYDRESCWLQIPEDAACDLESYL